MEHKPKTHRPTKLTRAAFDIETDGLLPAMTQIHCLVIEDLVTGEVFDYADQDGYTPIKEGVKKLMEFDIITGHNVLDFDVRAIQKIFMWFQPKKVIDTLILSRLAFPDIYSHHRVNNGLEKRYWMSHALGTWGMRLGMPKDAYTEEQAKMFMEQDPSLTFKEAKNFVWQTWNVSMHEYCIQDVKVTVRLYKFLRKVKLNPSSVTTEHYFAQLMLDQTSYGWEFDQRGALDLYNLLSEKVSELHTSFLDRWPGWYRPGKLVTVSKTRQVKSHADLGTITVKRFSDATGKELKPYIGPPKIIYEEGAKYTPIKFKAFNPGSRADCIYILKRHFGWKPTKWTEKGMEKMDEAVLKMVKDEIPLASELIDFYTLRKRLGQINDGRNGWLKKAKRVEDTDRYRMHGRINPLGTATHRCTHSNPNMGQVPAANEKMPYGAECRALFTSSPGMLLCGSDADALEMRMLAHYLSEFDGGAMTKAIESGSKAEGTDAHSRFRDMIGQDLLGEGDVGRDKAKTLRYAFNYGAGKTKLGKTIRPEASDKEAMALGSFVVRKMEQAGEGTVELNRKMKTQAEKTGHLTALDGRILPIRHAFAALNTLLQSAGAIYMKEVLVHHHKEMLAAGYEMKAGIWHYVGNIHDEFQADVHPDVYPDYARITVNSYLEVGDKMGILCPTRGTIDKGLNWASTH